MDCIEYMQFGFRFQILLFTTSVRFSTKTLFAFATQSIPKLPLNKIFKCGLAANNTTCVCVRKYVERLRRDAPGDRDPNTLKYKTTDKRVL